jgi:E3 ubiquitin-protein ligase RNF14
MTEIEEELATITAIFPELEIDPNDSHTATLELEIIPSTPLSIVFEPEAQPIPPPIRELRLYVNPIQYAQVAAAAIAPPDRHDIKYLPSLHLKITLPEGYPEHKPPSFELSTDPQWISKEEIQRLEEEGNKLWAEYGKSQVVYAYIDFVQQEAERGLGLQEITLPHELKTSILSHDKTVKRQKFEQETFSCGVCLEPKKGSACYQLHRCKHVFCISCLQDFYNSAITEGDVGTVKCLDPDCGKKGLTAEQRRVRKTRTLHPTELLAIPIERAQVQRYADLKLKKKLESDKSTVYCPRKWCQGPAKSARYARYETNNLEAYPESSDDEDDVANEPAAGGPADPAQVPAANPADPNAIPPPADDTRRARYSYMRPPPDRLNICSKCQYAFCRICQQTWHGEHINCLPRQTTELTSEEQASYDYIRLHTSACPTCNAACQKTHGCNHMRCFQCNTHFCYLCGAWLHAQDPYRHFNTKGSSCYELLWELEEGDEGGDAVGGGRDVFLGARRAEMEALHLREAEEIQAREFEAALLEGVRTR